MAFERTIYDYNGRFSLNDQETSPNRYVLVGEEALAETTTNTIQTDRPVAEGMIDFTSKISGGEFNIPIILFGKTMGDMNVLIDELKEAFNPQLVNDDPTWGKGKAVFPGGDGFMPMKWDEEVSSPNPPRGVQVFVKPLEVLPVVIDSTEGRVRAGKLKLSIEDPRKYSQDLSTMVDSGTANNGGNFRTPMKITIEKIANSPPDVPPPSPTISNTTTGDSITLTTSLVEGDVLVIDTRRQTVELNGVEQRSLLSTSSDWMHLAPGDNALVNSLYDGNYTVTFDWYDCWSI